MKTKASGYLRVSSKGQLKGHGPERQREDIAAFAKRNGFEITGWYQDAWTGTEDDRPAFLKMLEAMIGNGCRVVIVESLDRFARDLNVQMQLLTKMLGEGLTLVPANTGQALSAETLNDNPMLKAMIQWQGSFAELDKSLLVQKLRRARNAKSEAIGRRCEGPLPFGQYTDEVATLARIKSLIRKPRGGKRLSHGKIAKKLNAEELPTRTGVQWNRGCVWKICRDNGWG